MSDNVVHTLPYAEPHELECWLDKDGVTVDCVKTKVDNIYEVYIHIPFCLNKDSQKDSVAGVMHVHIPKANISRIDQGCIEVYNQDAFSIKDKDLRSECLLRQIAFDLYESTQNDQRGDPHGRQDEPICPQA